MAAGQVLLHHSISCQPHPLCLLNHGRPSNVLSQAITSSPKARPVSWGRWFLKVASAPSRGSRRPGFASHYNFFQ